MVDKKGSRGFGLGKLDKEAKAFLRPDFDEEKQYDKYARGMFPTVTTDENGTDGALEGDDC